MKNTSPHFTGAFIADRFDANSFCQSQTDDIIGRKLSSQVHWTIDNRIDGVACTLILLRV